jgi:serine/threonine protein kinase
VAIKVLRSDLLATPEQVEAFLGEARRAARLEHPGVVAIHDVGQSEGRCYIVQRFIDGPSLAQRLASNRLEIDEAVSLAARLADILHAAHAKGWVHRDIKPANILLDDSGSPHLADFGLAMELESMRRHDPGLAGTPRYIAPEVIAQAMAPSAPGSRDRLPRPDHRCDIYSLGTVLYEMLTGRPPYEAPTLRELFEMIDRADPTPPRLLNPDVSPQVEEVCLRAMDHDPNRRFRTASDLAAALRAATAPRVAEPAVALPEPPAARRVPVPWLAVGTVAAVTLIAIAIWAMWRPDPDPRPASPEVATGSANAPLSTEEALRLVRALLREREYQRDSERAGLPTSPPQTGDPARAEEGESEIPEPFRSEYEGPLREARQRGDEEREFSLLLKATNELIEAGHPAPARALAQRMVDVSGNNEGRMPIAYSQLGLAQYKLGRAEEAIFNYEHSLKIYRQLYEGLLKFPDSPKVLEFRSSMARMLGIGLNRVGNANKLLNRFQNARGAYQQAIEVLEPYDDRHGELSMALSNLGSLESNAGEHQAARAALERALTLARQTGDRNDVCEILINLGNARARAGDEAGAIAAYRESYQSMPPGASYEARAYVLANWIESLIAVEQLDDARELLPELRRIVRPDDEASLRVLELLEPLVRSNP